MSELWPMVPLGEVLEHRKEFVTIDDTRNYKRCRVQLNGRGIVLRDQVNGLEIKTKSQQVCRQGEFLVAEIDAKNGGYGIVPAELDGAVVSSHYFLFALNESRLDRRFLQLCSQVPAFQDQVRAQGTTNYAAIRPRDVLGYTIPLPPLAEQRRIVAHVEAIASRITEGKRLREEAVASRKALGHVILRDLLPAEIERQPLRDCIAPGSRISYGVLVPGDTVEDGVPFVRVQDLDPRTPPPTPNKRIARHIEAQYARTRLDGSEVLIGVVGSIGKVGTVPPSWAGANIARAVCRIVPGPSINREYLIAVLRSPAAQDYFQEATRTLAQPTLNVAQLEETMIPLPPLPTQEAIVRQLRNYEERIERLGELHSATAAELDALLPAVLNEAFAGRL